MVCCRLELVHALEFFEEFAFAFPFGSKAAVASPQTRDPSVGAEPERYDPRFNQHVI